MKIFSATLSMVIAATAKVVVGCEDCNSQCLGNLKWGGDYTGCSKEFAVSEDLTQTISYSFISLDLVPLSGDDNLLPRMYNTSAKKAPGFVMLCQADLNEKMTCLSSGFPPGNAEHAVLTATSWGEDCQVQDFSVSAQVVNRDKASNQLKISSVNEEYSLTSLDNHIPCGPTTKDDPFWYGEIQPNGDKTTVTCIVGCNHSSFPHDMSSAK